MLQTRRIIEVVKLDDDNAGATALNEDTKSNQCSTKKRPTKIRAANDELKRLRMHEDALKISDRLRRAWWLQIWCILWHTKTIQC